MDALPPLVFISYSQLDRQWLDRLLPHLASLAGAEVWYDRTIAAGEQWLKELDQALARARVAVCLITESFLASNFCTHYELPVLLERRNASGMLLLPLIVEPCPWRRYLPLRNIQLLPSDKQTIRGDYAGREDEIFGAAAARISSWLTAGGSTPPAPEDPTGPLAVDLSRLPVSSVSGGGLIGRKKELQTLDEAWESYDTGVVVLVGEGGTGKSALVERWLQRMSGERFRGARRVYGWSFYSQGSGTKATSADEFLAVALDEWFEEDSRRYRSSWEKGNCLVRLLRDEPALLILDGLEPLQSTLSYQRGQVTDPGLARLVFELSRDNPGLLVITTREPVFGLIDAGGDRGAQVEWLEEMSFEDGAALLAAEGVAASAAELRTASSELENHALALRLLAGYLRDMHGGALAGMGATSALPRSAGGPAQRVMAAFARGFGAGPELGVLGLLGLFDRPCEEAAIKALSPSPPIVGLTDRLPAPGTESWLQLLQRLRAAGLVAPESRHAPGSLDAHPLVREHFGQSLRTQAPDAWREGNRRLYVHYSISMPRGAASIPDLMPLYDAMVYGVRAGQTQAALDDVYWHRLLRRDEQFSWSRLGASGSDLAAIASFFTRPWDQLIEGIAEKDAGFVLGQAGLYLGLLGRFREALEPYRLGVERDIRGKNFTNASVTMGNLASTHLALGELQESLEAALESVRLADQGGNVGERIISRTHVGRAYHYLGRFDEAHRLFEAAEHLHQGTGSEIPFLYAGQGREYAELLLDGGNWSEVQLRAKRALDTKPIGPQRLAYAEAIVQQVRAEGQGDLDQALAYLDQVVELERAGAQLDQLPLALLSRAEARRYQGDHEGTGEDLDEALQIARQSGMRLVEVEGLLCYARLYLGQGERGKARASCTRAEILIEKTGYLRRQQELSRLHSRIGHRESP